MLALAINVEFIPIVIGHYLAPSINTNIFLTEYPRVCCCHRTNCFAYCGTRSMTNWLIGDDDDRNNQNVYWHNITFHQSRDQSPVLSPPKKTIKMLGLCRVRSLFSISTHSWFCTNWEISIIKNHILFARWLEINRIIRLTPKPICTHYPVATPSAKWLHKT